MHKANIKSQKTSAGRWTTCGLIALAVTSMLAIGCRNNSVVPVSDNNRLLQSSSGDILVANRKSPLPDVPAPLGFDLIPARSTGRVNPGGTREVRHVYQGIADFSAAVEYYRRTLADHGWETIAQIADGSDTLLTYRSPRETLDVRLSKPGHIMNVTVIIHSREYNARP